MTTIEPTVWVIHGQVDKPVLVPASVQTIEITVSSELVYCDVCKCDVCKRMVEKHHQHEVWE